MSARRAVDFYSVGQFVSGPGWRHLRRTIDTFELMFVRRGVLPMRVGEQTLHIEAGQIALLPPNVEHAGADIITSDVDFYWMHFKLPDARMLPDDAGLPQDDHCLLLPDERTLPDPDRLAVMCGQLIDIYARFGPYSNAYCDYFATGLLLEVSAQERLKADFAAIVRLPATGATASPSPVPTASGSNRNGPCMSIRPVPLAIRPAWRRCWPPLVDYGQCLRRHHRGQSGRALPLFTQLSDRDVPARVRRGCGRADHRISHRPVRANC